MALYFRMFIGMAVSLYTSRVILDVLGVEDFGVYNVVAGIVSLFSFLNASMSGATSRFITFELGKGSIVRLRRIFCSAMLVHIFIAIMVLVLCETIGLWLLKTKLNIPQESKDSAMWVFQCAILSTAVGITQVPYMSCIIAHERMRTFAFTDLLNTFMKLGIVYILIIVSGNKLRIYGLLVLAISFSITLIYRIYCIKQFDECHFSFKNIDKTDVKCILSFSGWDLFGNFSWVVRIQGINLLINIFFGAIANAAIGVANQVQGALTAFSNSIIMAIKPPIIKSYAQGQESKVLFLMNWGIKITFIALLIISIPLIINIDYVLNLWLSIIPQYTPIITQLTILSVLFSIIPTLTISGVHATGNIKLASVVNGLIYLSTVPITYVLYKFEFSIYVPFIINIITVLICGCTNFIYLAKYVKTAKIRVFFFEIIIPYIINTLLCLGLCALISFYLPGGNFLSFILSCVVFTLVTIIVSSLVLLSSTERTKIKRIINSLCKIIIKKVSQFNVF